jgi:hypothetical protein
MGRVAHGQQGAVRGYWLGATPSTGAINTFLTIQTALPNAAGELKVVVCFIIPGCHAPPMSNLDWERFAAPWPHGLPNLRNICGWRQRPSKANPTSNRFPCSRFPAAPAFALQTHKLYQATPSRFLPPGVIRERMDQFPGGRGDTSGLAAITPVRANPPRFFWVTQLVVCLERDC